jgi:hypothetical protein
MDVVVWLRSLGLGKYEAAFRENEIDETVLPNLTAEDLKDLGVSIVGHRRKILDAIAALGNDASANAPSADATTTSSAPSPSPEDRAERRQVTVMFSDLVGSTALSARMDPEDLREVISAYQKCVAETVQRFGGFVAKYMGGLSVQTPSYTQSILGARLSGCGARMICMQRPSGERKIRLRATSSPFSRAGHGVFSATDAGFQQPRLASTQTAVLFWDGRLKRGMSPKAGRALPLAIPLCLKA